VFSLISDFGVDPLEFFSKHKLRMRSLDVDARNSLQLQLTDEDLRAWLCADAADEVSEMLLFDEALWLVGTSRKAGLLFSGRLPSQASNSPAHSEVHTQSRHYLLKGSTAGVRVDEVAPSLSYLYEQQGIPALRTGQPGAHELALRLCD
jgi:hypothetical protein